MTLSWMGDLLTWIIVFFGWWFVHQLGEYKLGSTYFFMRLGFGGCVLSLAIVTVFFKNLNIL